MKKKIKIIISIFLVFITLIIGVIIYDVITTRNQYGIDEKKIEIPVFVYHDIVNDKSQMEFEYMQTTAKRFEKQILGLQKVGYHFISYEDLQAYKDGKKELYKKSCLLTFDDGYQGVYENAYPILKENNVPATIFVITENMNESNVITWEEANEMQESGLITIASHSIEHPKFTDLTVEEAVKNVNTTYEIIEENLGKQKLKIFTYPYGLYTQDQIEALGNEGYIQNLTDNMINNSKELDMRALHRGYPLNDSLPKILLKIYYRSIKY